jgi:phosphoribosylformylglycinamidine (FGAM) synthase-like amidotransferase family enzyme
MNSWAATIKFNPQVYEQFTAFRARKDTFSLGVCNGCQVSQLHFLQLHCNAKSSAVVTVL